jgi:hypothetical protein
MFWHGFGATDGFFWGGGGGGIRILHAHKGIVIHGLVFFFFLCRGILREPDGRGDSYETGTSMAMKPTMTKIDVERSTGRKTCGQISVWVEFPDADECP